LTLPWTTGFNNIPVNLPATVQNTGWEFVLSSVIVKSAGLTWESSINLTIARNKLIAYPDLSTSPYQYSYIIGQPLSIQQLYHSTGVDPATGLYEFMGKSGHSITTPDFFTDRTSLLSTLPKYYGGWENSFQYKGFRLDIFFQFINQLGINPIFLSYNPPGITQYNVPSNVLDRWQMPGDKAPVEQYTQSFNSAAYTAFQNTRASDYYYTDASYFRLKNLSISYQLAQGLVKKMGFQSCRIYLHAQNLFTITKYKGPDPENQSLTALPLLRVITGGIQFVL
jgi:hypothetical protein